ncbi:DUF262 domain-containing protein [Ekhidna sp.]|uniref:DUF262 domain-containing protein n=1 Tax=Ekhidna sp. TaxID=2608089 RepID=UPI003B598718
MIEYRVRSISLLNLINDIRKGALIPDAYFQRNLVWREIHKKDFIKTILLGYPFPQIFISKGKVDVETMSTISCIVDGQQRTNAIQGFINNEFDVEGQYYESLSESKKSEFLKYEIAVIELDLENDDPKVQEIFQRINRTSNSLTAIEKLASEYSTSEYMLVAKLLGNQIDLDKNDNNEDFREDPNIPDEYFEWAKSKNVANFVSLITNRNIYTARDLAKKAHLMHVLNMMSTYLTDFFNRNEKTIDFLNDYAVEFEEKDDLLKDFEHTAKIINDLDLNPKSIWFSKSNIFSLIVGLANNSDRERIDMEKLKQNLDDFELDIPADYKLASTEGVNNKRERELRNKYVSGLIQDSIH